MAIVIDPDATSSLERYKQPQPPRTAMAAGIPDNDSLDPIDLDRAPEAMRRRYLPARRGRRRRYPLPSHLGNRLDIYA
ncbi:MAG: hypothetical protein EA384_02775 [Spirochaetaceae bacterium]|nr:MAG: hypothetical protein EA384_02775 [Spirochaetaceae bacterium]